MSFEDVEHARITEMVGIGHPVAYAPDELRLIATHEAGHATTAWLVAPRRHMEVLTIVRRGSSLGLLAHDDLEEVYTHSRDDLRALVQIAMGGWVAEELFCGEMSTGPASDLAAATRTAAHMVGAAGMGSSLVSFAALRDALMERHELIGDEITAVLDATAARQAVPARQAAPTRPDSPSAHLRIA